MQVDDAAARGERVSAAALGWLLLPLAVAVAVPLTAVLAPPLGRFAFPRPPVTYWPEITAVRKPTVQAGYALLVVWVLAYVAAIVALGRRGMVLVPAVRRAAVLAVQLLCLVVLGAAWRAHLRPEAVGTRVFFTDATIIAAGLMAAVAVLGLRYRSRDERRRRWREVEGSHGLRIACAALALLATCIWVLPAVYTDAGLVAAPEALFLGAWFFDESSAVVNGRSPLVNMVAYGNLWPYLVGLPLRVFGDTYATFTVTMATLTGAALLALYATLVRVTRSAAAALALYLPVLAMAFFVETGTLVARYSPGNYYGMFPIRYAGPCFLALATATYLDAAERRRRTTIALFAGAGLVSLNNLDFGGAALAGTFVALLLTRRQLDVRGLGRLGSDVAVGLLAALALVSLVTLVRAGALPHLSLMTRYGRIFVIGGNGNLPLPALGLHVVITLTFIGALATAGARAAARAPDAVLTGMLAWSGLFGLGAGAYYYTYRSHRDVLINLFAIWALALALLVVVVMRERAPLRREGAIPALAVLAAFGLAVCSLAQVPTPWSQLRRIAGHVPPGQGSYFPPDGFRDDAVKAVVAQQAQPGERLLLLSPMGHRIAHDAGVVNVSPYPGLGQMPTHEQLHEALSLLRAEGGSRVFVVDRVPRGFEQRMTVEGFQQVGAWTVTGWPANVLTEYQPSSRAADASTLR